MSVDKVGLIENKPQAKTDWDKWILQKLDETTKSVTENIEKYNFSQASEILREFTWSDFADWHLEVCKVGKFQPKADPSLAEESNTDEIKLYVLQNLLKLWHPYMPFVTEKIWGEMSNDLLMIQKWPEVKTGDKFDAGKIEWTKELINLIRNIRAEAKIPPAEKLIVDFAVSADKKELVESQLEIIKFLARLTEVNFVDIKSSQSSVRDCDSARDGLVGQIADLKFKLNYEAKVDSKSKDKEQEELKKYIVTLEAKLSDESFIAKAPPVVVEKEKHKLEEAKKKLI
jgi:valyl-tRNA synthetase